MRGTLFDLIITRVPYSPQSIAQCNKMLENLSVASQLASAKDDDWSIQSKRRQVIFQAQVGNRYPFSSFMKTICAGVLVGLIAWHWKIPS